MLDEHVSLRRVAAALNGLPMGAWPEADHGASWSVTDYLLANVIDEVRQLTWVLAQVNSKRKVERPEPVYRPGTRKPAAAPRRAGGWGEFARTLMREVTGG